MRDRGKARTAAAVLFAVALVLSAAPGAIPAREDASPLREEVDRLAADIEGRVVAWRRDFHQHPELSNREFRTAGIVAEHLRRLGYEVKTEVAHTGVVGLLKGGRPGPVVALRADMDALPVTEEVDLPFTSRVKATYRGREVGVMHACGHDAHTAILMGVAEVLARMRERLPGTVKLVFQPAEEGAPEGEEGGAELMIKEGVLESPRPDAIFGLHVWPVPESTVGYRAGPMLASADSFTLVVRGKQTHGARPWNGVDPIITSAHILTALQTIVSRHTDISSAPAVVTVGAIHGGIRFNIIPDEVEMLGTVRTFDPDVRRDIHERIRKTAAGIAESQGATAEVTFHLGYPPTINDPDLTRRMVPTLERVVGKEKVLEIPLFTVAEDFSFFQQEIPGLYILLGVVPEGTPPEEVAMNHSPLFFVDEDALITGVRALSHLTVDYMGVAGQAD